jgi:hypothetical protein
MSAHTPGPWTYDLAPHAEGQKPFAFCISGAQYFADVHVLATDADTARAEADARLIAAAPDMLAEHEANARLLALVIHDLVGRVERGKLAALQQCLDRSNEVIAKARGA